MENNYLSDATYDELYDYLYNLDPTYASQFASYFTELGPEYQHLHQCTNYDGYMNWLATMFEDGDYGLFVAWDDASSILSNQGGGGFKITF